ncbi:hypothetical protein ABT58_12920 [Photobacterium aphoticum]|uniref:LysM domain-containing protein n=1 Tax=Photobacterium aphoticum TaxID=754436 RepID=A0A0J1JFL7_9GAMM|nr:hypothetical protein ABT58_12920 [Photobacterium aphoticum]
MPYVFLASVVIFIAGCQNISPNMEEAHVLQPPVHSRTDALSSSLPDKWSVATINHRCPISSEQFKGRYIATGNHETLQTHTSHATVLPPLLNTEPPELWDELSAQFSMHVPNNRRIRQHKRWFINNPYHIEVVTARAEPFLYYLYEQVKARNLPIELTLLPFVESSFDQFAHSHKGAAGLWQITAPTGKTFGLTIVPGYDGRRDIVASTQAALDLLEYLYERFDHNWLHAIAAYNTGGARVRNAIKQNRAMGKSTDFWALKLPRETRHYVPKLLAMAELVKQREKYDLHFASIKAQPQVEEVVIQERIRLKHLAGYAGMSSKTLYQLNPGYTGGYTMKKTENKILLPVTHRTKFYENEKSKRVTKYRFMVYDIQAGDSLNQLASLNDTSVDVIKQVNYLSHSYIFAGQKILIPE